MKGYKARTAYAALTAALVFSAAGCSGAEQASGDQAGSPSNALVIQTVPETIAPLGLNGQILPALTDVDLPDTEPARNICGWESAMKLLNAFRNA